MLHEDKAIRDKLEKEELLKLQVQYLFKHIDKAQTLLCFDDRKSLNKTRVHLKMAGKYIQQLSLVLSYDDYINTTLCNSYNNTKKQYDEAVSAYSDKKTGPSMF